MRHNVLATENPKFAGARKFPRPATRIHFIQCQNHPDRRTAGILVNPLLGWLGKGGGGSCLSKGYKSERERYRATKVRTHLLRGCIPALYPLPYGDFSWTAFLSQDAESGRCVRGSGLVTPFTHLKYLAKVPFKWMLSSLDIYIWIS